MIRHILVVGRDAADRNELERLLAGEGCSVVTAESAEGVDERPCARPFEAVFFDLRDCAREGTAPVVRLARRFPGLPLIAIHRSESSALVAEALERGACDALAHPFATDALRIVLRRVSERTAWQRQNALLERELLRAQGERAIVAASEAMIALLEQVERAASCDGAVLLVGERGTGKEVLARAIHAQSLRRDGPFVAIHCGGTRGEPLAQKLFGRSSASTPQEARFGGSLLAAAHGGTVYLDEIAALPPALQAQLVAASQDLAGIPVGDHKRVAGDVRIMAATTLDLAGEARAGRFREDLLARLEDVRLDVPALRDRRKDIPLLADHFLAHHRELLARPVRRVSDEALEQLLAHDWPGNVRELENVIERAVIVAHDDVIEPAELGIGNVPGRHVRSPRYDSAGQTDDLSMRRARRLFEADLIRRALARTGGNRTRAARLLEISHRALLYKLKEYGIRD